MSYVGFIFGILIATAYEVGRDGELTVKSALSSVIMLIVVGLIWALGNRK